MRDHHLAQVDDRLGIGEHEGRLRVQLQGSELLGQHLGVGRGTAPPADLEVVNIEAQLDQMRHRIVERADDRVEALREQAWHEHQPVTMRAFVREDRCSESGRGRLGQQLGTGRPVSRQPGTDRRPVDRAQVAGAGVGQRG